MSGIAFALNNYVKHLYGSKIDSAKQGVLRVYLLPLLRIRREQETTWNLSSPLRLFPGSHQDEPFFLVRTS